MTEKILELSNKDLITHLSNSLNYISSESNTIFNSIYVSGEYIAASEGSKMLLTKLSDSTSNNYVLLDSKDIAVVTTALKALKKLEKREFNVVIEKIDNIVNFTVFNCFKELKFTYVAEALAIKPPAYKQCLVQDKKVLGLFKKSSLLEALKKFKNKNDIVTLTSKDAIEFDESIAQASFYVKDLLTLVKTSNQEGILLYTDKEAERVLRSPVFIEQDNITAVVMPVCRHYNNKTFKTKEFLSL